MSAELLQNYAELYARLPAVSAVTSGSRASAYLLSGEDEDGLNTLARIVAARLCGISLDKAFCDHADIIVYPKPPETKKSSKTKDGETKAKRYAISVEDIREIVDSLYLTPFELDKKVFIIENAESMSEICQNKLLKSLEEPPARVCFILCACGRLLPTVESRCNRIELPPFDIAEAERALSAHHKNAEDVKLAARASRGNIGLAERMLADKGFADTYASAKKILALAVSSKMFVKTAAVYEKFTRDKADAVLGIIEFLLDDIARLLCGAPTVFAESDVRGIAAGFTPYSAAACAEHVRTARRQNAANCMIPAVMDNLILNIMQQKSLKR